MYCSRCSLQKPVANRTRFYSSATASSSYQPSHSMRWMYMCMQYSVIAVLFFTVSFSILVLVVVAAVAVAVAAVAAAVAAITHVTRITHKKKTPITTIALVLVSTRPITVIDHRQL
uniref:Uncharacterized protein n=1 Tax=Lygus hesperus TaxID=30085 RepID=A0A146LS90_LYGHE